MVVWVNGQCLTTQDHAHRTAQRWEPFGANDVKFAACAHSEGPTLVTDHVGEFARVQGLVPENGVGA